MTTKTVKVAPVAPVKKARKPRASQAEMARRELASLTQRASELQAYINLGDKLFGGTANTTDKAQATPKAASTEKTRQGGPTLEVAFRKVLGRAGKLSLEDAADAVLASGYQTKAKKFLPCIQQLAFKMRRDNQLVIVDRDGHKALYSLGKAA